MNEMLEAKAVDPATGPIQDAECPGPRARERGGRPPGSSFVWRREGGGVEGGAGDWRGQLYDVPDLHARNVRCVNIWGSSAQTSAEATCGSAV